jgi:plastocyanin
MGTMTKRWALLGAAGLAIAASLAAACGGGGSDSSATKPAATTAATTAPTKAAAPTSAATSAATAQPTQASGNDQPSGDGTTLTLVAKNTLFDKSELKASPGAITIIEDNQDDGIPHNVHVYKGKDNKGQDMGMTQLEAGPIKQELKLTVEKGDYFYVCDVHPATMSGKLEVE